MFKQKLIYVSVLVICSILFAFGGAVMAEDNPVVYDNWNSGDAAFECAQIGDYSGAYKINAAAPNGNYIVDAYGNTITISASDGKTFDWSSTFGIGAVIVKAGTGANVWFYEPQVREDSGLYGYENKDISHVTFCWATELMVTKDTYTSLTRTYDWTIEKSVTPSSWDLFTGDSGTSAYTVNVTKLGYTDSNWAVEGTITIFNPDPEYSAKILSVTDVVSPDIMASVECGVTFPYTLEAEQTLYCDYSANLPNADARTNTATVTTEGVVRGSTGTAAVDFTEATVNKINDSISVIDTNGMSWDLVSDSATWSYEKTFTCNEDEGTHSNTATIVETEQSDDASVTVACYALDVTKNADTSLTRTWTWQIDKSGDQTELLLAIGQSFLVNYEVIVSATYEDSDWAVEGKIWIANPNPTRSAELTEVSDLVSPDIVATVNCPSLTILAGETLECTYSADLPNAEARTNTATATLQNYAYDAAEVATASGTTGFSGSANVIFDEATVEEVDECVNVSDDIYGPLGTVCADQAPYTFEYSMTVGPYDECGTYEFVNVASFITNDTSTMGEDNHIVDVTVPCLGCTLTPGYWKTHSEYGPAPYDDTWAMLPEGADTEFFLSGMSYYDVLWTPPAGNAYYILAHAYIAAQLNQLAGADFSEVETVFDAATVLFEEYTPADVADMRGNNPTRKLFIELAGTLDDYNNGLIGPGHCDEDQFTDSFKFHEGEMIKIFLASLSR